MLFNTLKTFLLILMLALIGIQDAQAQPVNRVDFGRTSRSGDLVLFASAAERVIEGTSDTRWEVRLFVVNRGRGGARNRARGQTRFIRRIVGQPNSREVVGTVNLRTSSNGIAPNQFVFTDTTALPNTTYEYKVANSTVNDTRFLRVDLPALTGVDELFGGRLSARNSISFCTQDGTPDFVDIRVRDQRGDDFSFLVTRPSADDLDVLEIVAITEDVEAFDFDALPSGTYVLFSISLGDNVTGLSVGSSTPNLGGDFSLSNGLAVSLLNCPPDGGRILSNATTRFCAGDGQPDNVSISLRRARGDNMAWIVTDENGDILGLPAAPEQVDFDGAGVGRCFIYHVAWDGDISGLAPGSNIDDLSGGDFDLSNRIPVNRVDCSDDGLAAPANTNLGSTAEVAGAAAGRDRFEQVNSLANRGGSQEEVLFPNPALNQISVQPDGVEGGAHLSIFSLTLPGAPVYQGEFDAELNGATKQININNLNAGNYVLLIQYPSGRTERVNFRKQQ